MTCLPSAEAGTSFFQMGSRGEDVRSKEISLNWYQGRFIDRLKFHIPLRQYTALSQLLEAERKKPG